jgi:glycosyl hydrolase family 26
MSAPRPSIPAAIVPNGAEAATAGSSQTPAPSRSMVSMSSLLQPNGKYFGIEVNGAPDSTGPVATVATSIGASPNMIGQYVRWNRPFDTAAASNTVNYGALYYMAWEPYGATVRSIADGGSDVYITKFARAVRAFHQPVALSFGHEMNGNWYPWGTTGATAADFVAAWRHIHDLFAQAGATNVIWVWNPNIVNPMPQVQLEPYWPGSAYVDWVGVTGYFALTGAHTFDGLYDPTMTEIRQFTDKPFIIAETSIQTGASELTSAQELMSGVKDNNDVLGLVWFNYLKDGVDWTLTGRPQLRATMASLLESFPLARPATGR